MVQKNIWKLFVKLGITLFVILNFSNCVAKNELCVQELSGGNGNSTYCIVDALSNQVIYDGGCNEIRQDTIINRSYVFIEDLMTEECSDRIIVYNPQRNILMRAYNLGWCLDLREIDRIRLFEGMNKPYEIDKLDIRHKKIKIVFFNDSTAILDLKEDSFLIDNQYEMPIL